MSLNWFEKLRHAFFQSVSTCPYELLEEGHIRVLRLIPLLCADNTTDTKIEGELIHVPLNEPIHYEALSYVWGLPLQTHTIRIKSLRHEHPGEDEKALPITESLWVALRHLRYRDEPRYLWVDQICVNQKDTAEKNIQVRCMGEIYSKAVCSVIWLGPKGPDAELMQDMYTKLSKSLPSNKGPGGVQMLDQQILAAMLGTSTWEENNKEMVRKRRQILQQFLDLPWFTRAWVYQEAVTPPKVDVFWGTIVLPFDFVTGLIVSAYSIAKGSDDRRWHKRIKSTTGFAPLRAIFHDRTAHRNGELNFLNVLWHARKHLSAGNHRDYVYAFLAVNKYTVKDRTHPSNARLNKSLFLQDHIIPDYDATVEHVYTNLALAAIQITRNLDIFQYIVPTKQIVGGHFLPSWVPNWADKNFICGSPIFVPGVPWETNASQILGSEARWIPERIANPLELPTSGFTLGRIEIVLRHSFKHTYFSSTLKNALRLDDLAALIETERNRLSQPHFLAGSPLIQRRPPTPLPRTTILETILANGSFTPSQSVAPYTTTQLLSAYDDEKETIPPAGEDSEGEKMRNWLRQTAEMAAGKRVFLMAKDMEHIGLGFSTVKAGDIVVVLFGCRAPVVLRRQRKNKEGGDEVGDGDDARGERERRYKVVGLCFVHGCMDGSAMTSRWRGRVPERFVLV
ncbi:hypothetical protein QQS21_003545 [Conoideocrella luteorostrata]|uniref:Heterokaryon incompatibility domain-containing protein n=1 Tax=Conoideocrella luteorostrata TaxID=1105319 RepID=A0AAJ0CX64_9HYPO|nr:hypothetical protein QQS21_003545 [Conoideocrella luteorostrata]